MEIKFIICICLLVATETINAQYVPEGPEDRGRPGGYGGGSCNCLRWTNWINADTPSDTGDWETLGPPDERGRPGTIHHVRPDICTVPVRMECRAVGEKTPWYQTNDKITYGYECNAQGKGFACLNKKQGSYGDDSKSTYSSGDINSYSGNKCLDYEARVLCFYTGYDECPCLYWTKWYNSDNPTTGDGDEEIIGYSIPKYVCEGNNEPVDVQCKTVAGLDVFHAGNRNIKCDLRGLTCYNGEQGKNCKCHDYEVRFLCPRFTANYPIRAYGTGYEKESVDKTDYESGVDKTVTGVGDDLVITGDYSKAGGSDYRESRPNYGGGYGVDRGYEEVDRYGGGGGDEYGSSGGYDRQHGSSSRYEQNHPRGHEAGYGHREDGTYSGGAYNGGERSDGDYSNTEYSGGYKMTGGGHDGGYSGDRRDYEDDQYYNNRGGGSQYESGGRGHTSSGGSNYDNKGYGGSSEYGNENHVVTGDYSKASHSGGSEYGGGGGGGGGEYGGGYVEEGYGSEMDHYGERPMYNTGQDEKLSSYSLDGEYGTGAGPLDVDYSDGGAYSEGGESYSASNSDQYGNKASTSGGYQKDNYGGSSGSYQKENYGEGGGGSSGSYQKDNYGVSGGGSSGSYQTDNYGGGGGGTHGGYQKDNYGGGGGGGTSGGHHYETSEYTVGGVRTKQRYKEGIKAASVNYKADYEVEAKKDYGAGSSADASSYETQQQAGYNQAGSGKPDMYDSKDVYDDNSGYNGNYN